MNNIVISKAFDYGIVNYIKNKDNVDGEIFNSFLVVVVRIIFLIYGEEDVIKAFNLNKKDELYKIICKYGFEKDKFIDFLNQLDLVYEEMHNNDVNSYFENIERILIDMLALRKKSEGNIDVIENRVYNLLYTKDNSNFYQISYKFANETMGYDISEYFKEELAKYNKIADNSKRIYLNLDIYPIFGVDINKVKTLSDEELSELNKRIYDFYGIKESTINKDYIIEQEIEKHKNNPVVLEGANGYVDILLVFGVIITLLLTILIFVQFI